MSVEIFNFEYPTVSPNIIKVIGVGGGGGNAVTHMFEQGIHDVSFVLCNTDNQALLASPIPTKVQLGTGLGAGGNPEKAKQAALSSEEGIRKIVDDGTKMVFITAGMGGGTGTGAAPIVARIAKEMGVLTVAIVTIPFAFEGRPKILQALYGVEELAKHVDALLVVNNERLRDIYKNLSVVDAFKHADNTLTLAAKSISEIITLTGKINLDFADVESVLKDGGVAIMSSGTAKGENRVQQAINNALTSPLLNNNDIYRSKKILFNIVSSTTSPLMMEEMDLINDFMAKFNKEIVVIWGTGVDDNLEEEVKITILSTGFGIDDIPLMGEKNKEDAQLSRQELAKKEEEEVKQLDKENKLLEKYYGEGSPEYVGKPTRPRPILFTQALLDDDQFIDSLLQNPTHKRNLEITTQLMQKSMK